MWELLERSTPTLLLDGGRSDRLNFIEYPYPGSLIVSNTYPILPHLLLSPLSRLASPLDIAAELYLLRLISIVLAVGVVAIAWVIIRRIFPDQPQFWLAIPAFIVFLPMHTHIFATVNTDVFAILLTSILLLMLMSFFDSGVSKLRIFLVAALVGLAFLTKRTVVFSLLWVALTAILYVGYQRQWSTSRKISVGLITILGIGAGLAWIIANSEFLADSMIKLFNMNIGRALSGSYLVTADLSLPELAEVYAKSGLFAFITFWGNFGGANINIPWPWAWVLMGFCGVVIFGAGWYIFEAFRSEKSDNYLRNVLLIFISGIILSLMNAFFPVLVTGPVWGPPAPIFFSHDYPNRHLLFSGRLATVPGTISS